MEMNTTHSIEITTTTGEVRSLELVPAPFCGFLQTAEPVRIRKMKRDGSWAKRTVAEILIVDGDKVYAFGYGPAEIEIV